MSLSFPSNFARIFPSNSISWFDIPNKISDFALNSSSASLHRKNEKSVEPERVSDLKIISPPPPKLSIYEKNLRLASIISFSLFFFFFYQS